MVNLPKIVKKTLADVLLQEGLVTQGHIADASQRMKASGDSLAITLHKMQAVPEPDLARAICKQYNLPYIDASRYSVPRELTALFSVEEMQEGRFVVLDRIGRVLLMAVADTPPVEVLEALEKETESTIFVFVTTSAQLSAAIRKYFPAEGAPAAHHTPKAVPAAKAAPSPKAGTAPKK